MGGWLQPCALSNLTMDIIAGIEKSGRTVTRIRLTRIFGPRENYFFETQSGRLERDETQDGAVHLQGNCFVRMGHTFALYANNDSLYFQIDEKYWNLTSPDVHVVYGHDFSKAVTVFSIDDFRLEYHAWWKDDPHFQKNLPERDADEDYLGYIYSVWQDRPLQASLIKAWNANQ